MVLKQENAPSSAAAFQVNGVYENGNTQLGNKSIDRFSCPVTLTV